MAPDTRPGSSTVRNRSSISVADIIAEPIDVEDSDAESIEEPPQKRRRTLSISNLPSTSQTQASISSGSFRVDSSEFQPTGQSSLISSDVEKPMRTVLAVSAAGKGSTVVGDVDALRAQLAAARDELDTLKQTFTRDLSSIEENASCEVCMQKLWYPYLLPRCGHAFCESCLLAWFRQNRPYFTCPSCRVAVREMPAEMYFVKQLVQNLSSAQGKLTGRPDMPTERAAGAKAELEALFTPQVQAVRPQRDRLAGLAALLRDRDHGPPYMLPLGMDVMYPYPLPHPNMHQPMHIDENEDVVDGPLPPLAPLLPYAPLPPPYHPPERERRRRRTYVPEVVITPRMRERERERERRHADVLPWVAENRRQMRMDVRGRDDHERRHERGREEQSHEPVPIDVDNPRRERGREDLGRDPNASTLLNNVPLQFRPEERNQMDIITPRRSSLLERIQQQQQVVREAHPQPGPSHRGNTRDREVLSRERIELDRVNDGLRHFLGRNNRQQDDREANSQLRPSDRRNDLPRAPAEALTRSHRRSPRDDDLSQFFTPRPDRPGPSNRTDHTPPATRPANVEVIDVDRDDEERRQRERRGRHRRQPAEPVVRRHRRARDEPHPYYPFPDEHDMELERDFREIEMDEHLDLGPQFWGLGAPEPFEYLEPGPVVEHDEYFNQAHRRRTR